jgi:ferredoxin-NADP reductase
MPSIQTRLIAQVQRVRMLSAYVNEYELSLADVGTLESYAPGAHIDVFLPQHGARQYSLIRPWRQGAHLEIAVQRERDGRGGSSWIHENLCTGAVVEIGQPRNLFALAPGDTHRILIAGGIGLTPLLCMARELLDRGASFDLIVCARDESRLIYADELLNAPLANHVRFVLDNGNPGEGLDARALLAAAAPGTQVYCCGPNSLMDAVRAAGSHGSNLDLHFEAFGAPSTVAASADDDHVPFEVVCRLSDITVLVQPHKSILDALLEAGVEVDHSCKEGWCGTCLTRWREGTPIHRDTCMSEKDRERYVAVCSALSANGEKLVLDI